jgi:hypothetical protein
MIIFGNDHKTEKGRWRHADGCCEWADHDPAEICISYRYRPVVRDRRGDARAGN